MNALVPSECSSGCESGWTMYLEHSFLNQNSSHGGNHSFCDEYNKAQGAEEDGAAEDDLSMVSDASSRPRHLPDHFAHYNEDHNSGCFYPQSNNVVPNKSGKRTQRVKESGKSADKNLASFLDDTASSPVFDFSMNSATVANQQASTESLLDLSQGFSATYFEGRSSFHDPYNYFQPSLKENELPNNQISRADVVSTFKIHGTEVAALEMQSFFNRSDE